MPSVDSGFWTASRGVLAADLSLFLNSETERVLELNLRPEVAPDEADLEG